MNYELKHIASVPEIRNQPAFFGNVLVYIKAIVGIAAHESAERSPPDTRAYLRVRPQGETGWLNCGLVDSLFLEDIQEAFATCINDYDEDRMEIEICWMTDIENEALPEFDGW